MQRLVYHPKAWAYIKTADNNVVDVTADIVSGEVSRRINQVSSATLTIRNDGFKYTPKKGSPTFHPMDAITIYLSRLPAFPVQVFTGFLDSSPYYQLYPGTVTLNASCTLKRLQYTFWDEALPYSYEFMHQYGWVTNPATGELYNQAALTTLQQIDQANPKSIQNLKLNDGSIGNLMYATLNRIGGWSPDSIWIEELPVDLWKTIQSLYQALQPEIAYSEQAIKSFFQAAIGPGAFGTGSAGGTGKIWAVKISAELASSGTGWTELSTNGYAANPPVDCGSLGTCDFSSLGQAYPHGTELIITNPANGKSGKYPLTDVGNGSSFAPAIGLTPTPMGYLGCASGDTVHIQLANGGSLSVASGFGTLVSANTNVNPPTTLQGNSGGSTNTGGSNKTNSNMVINPIPGFTGFSFDDGIDASAPAGSAVLAPAACTIVAFNPQFYGYAGVTDGSGGLLLLKFDQPLPNAPSQYWYISEHVLMTSTTSGHKFNQGDVVATFGGQGGGSGIEIGWGSSGTNVDSGRFAQTPAGGQSGNDIHFSSNTGWGWHFYNYFSIGSGNPVNAGSVATSTSGGGTGSGTSPLTTAASSAFATYFNFPSAEDVLTAVTLTGDRALMNDQPLLPFIQELSQGSMRSFQSLPNGNFFGFFPDYFGTFSHRTPYWEIDDVEILDGSIQLSDENLVTHMYVVGDTILPNQQIDLLEKVESFGVITLGTAHISDWLNGPGSNVSSKSGQSNSGLATTPGLNSSSDVNAFLTRYGARPLYDPEPTIRSHEFELVVAWQRFMQAWSRQFLTTFSFTFMPEIYPGGLVMFPSHGLHMYVEEVHHMFDYENGFTTQANLSSPAAISGTSTPFNQGLIVGSSPTPGSFSSNTGRPNPNKKVKGKSPGG